MMGGAASAVTDLFDQPDEPEPELIEVPGEAEEISDLDRGRRSRRGRARRRTQTLLSGSSLGTRANPNVARTTLGGV